MRLVTCEGLLLLSQFQLSAPVPARPGCAVVRPPLSCAGPPVLREDRGGGEDWED